MKQKLFLIGVAVWVLLSGYSIVAWRMLRGAGAYRLGTTAGSVLSHSWQYTALAAVLLLVVLGISLILHLRKKKKVAIEGSKKTAAMPTVPAKETETLGFAEPSSPTAETEKLSPAKPSSPTAETEKLSPAKPAAPTAETEKLSPAKPAAPAAETEKLSPAKPSAPAAETKALFSEKPASSTAGTEPLSSAKPSAPTAETEVLPPAETAENMPKAESPAPRAAARFCTQCGTALQPDQRFCTKCGAPVKGGS